MDLFYIDVTRGMYDELTITAFSMDIITGEGLQRIKFRGEDLDELTFDLIEFIKIENPRQLFFDSNGDGRIVRDKVYRYFDNDLHTNMYANGIMFYG